ncbi:MULTISPECIES: DUF4190 domain-containing protein [unclassified Nocardia]|uniref:DUF4190 domain-containing protein n=1 Tax=unclassified Nocardia TaxID=2637762 RepID=UPI001CE3C0AF|nr:MULTISPECIES: DUF4190 domain-containing protein [unclassified Nocardia]
MTYPPQQPYGPYGQQPYGYPAYYQRPPDHPQTTTIMILGILGVVMCQALSPIAWVMGRRALAEIDASGGAIGGRSNVQIGYICGIIGTILLILFAVLMVAAFALPFIFFGLFGTSTGA